MVMQTFSASCLKIEKTENIEDLAALWHLAIISFRCLIEKPIKPESTYGSEVAVKSQRGVPLAANSTSQASSPQKTCLELHVRLQVP